MKIKVGVLFGGKSVEHEVSIISAMQALKAFDTDKCFLWRGCLENTFNSN